MRVEWPQINVNYCYSCCRYHCWQRIITQAIMGHTMQTLLFFPYELCVCSES